MFYNLFVYSFVLILSFLLGFILSDNLYLMNILNNINKDNYAYILEGIISFLIFFILMSYYVFYEKYNKLIKNYLHKDLSLTNNIIASLSENIHHELHTPIEVLRTLLERKNIYENMSIAQNSLDQMISIIDRVAEFKHLRYSNGNKNIYDIVEGAFKLLSIENRMYDFKISDNLKKFKISNNLKNGDLLSIIINHLKNSLEANATFIEVKYSTYKNNYLEILIVDNGNGIQLKNKEDIFKPNISSKSNILGIRGNGMFINKYILEKYDGEVKVIHTSPSGTIIRLKLKAIQIS